jgi:two-component system cell cycle sensor histidine kinase/response regulator CckA
VSKDSFSLLRSGILGLAKLALCRISSSTPLDSKEGLEMFSQPRWIHARARKALAALVLIALVARLDSGCAFAASPEPAGATPAAPGVLTTFQQIWSIPEPLQREWHRVRFDYDVYYYDPLWKSMWGRSDVESYLSLGTKVFPIKVGQRIRIEGRMQLALGMLVDDPSVSVIEESIPLEVLPATGDVANVLRFDKRVVTFEGYVDRQMVRDANHLEFQLIVGDRVVHAQVLLRNDIPLPQLQGQIVRAQGVYFARADPNGGPAKIELWIQRSEDIHSLGTIDRDPRFSLPPTPLNELANLPVDTVVRVVGQVQGQVVGKSVTLQQDSTKVVLH